VTLGYNATATNQSAMAIGTNTFSRGNSSFVGGSASEANANSSFAFGTNCIASGFASMAIGNGSKANSQSTIALGEGASASGLYSMAIGNHAKSFHNNQYVIGRYNKDIGNSALFVVGNGWSGAESNALVVKTTGDLVAAGNIYANGDKKLATEERTEELKKYV
jgi:hypothetical protein